MDGNEDAAMPRTQNDGSNEGPDVAIGEHVRSVLAAHGRSVRWAGLTVLDVNQTEIQRRVTGRKPFTVRELTLLADALNVQVADLIPDEVPGDVADLPASAVVLTGRQLGAPGVVGRMGKAGKGTGR